MTRNLLQRPEAGALTREAPRATRSIRRLGSDEVDLWRVSLDGYADEALRAFRALLSPDEEERAGGFYFERDRRRFIAGRALLRRVLARYLGRSPAALQFEYQENGKPALALETAAPRFNVAHSEDVAVFAVTRETEVGVDVEHLRELPDWESITATYFSAAEQARLRTVPAQLRRIEFFRAWTRQEAALKATGAGLGALEDGPTDLYADPNADGENPAFRGAAAPPFRVYPFVPADGYVAALAVDPELRWVTCFNGVEDDIRGTGRRSRRRPLDQMAKTGAEFL